MMPFTVKINPALRKHIIQKIGSERVKYCVVGKIKLLQKYIYKTNRNLSLSKLAYSKDKHGNLIQSLFHDILVTAS